MPPRRRTRASPSVIINNFITIIEIGSEMGQSAPKQNSNISETNNSKPRRRQLITPVTLENVAAVVEVSSEAASSVPKRNNSKKTKTNNKAKNGRSKSKSNSNSERQASKKTKEMPIRLDCDNLFELSDLDSSDSSLTITKKPARKGKTPKKGKRIPAKKQIVESDVESDDAFSDSDISVIGDKGSASNQTARPNLKRRKAQSDDEEETDIEINPTDVFSCISAYNEGLESQKFQEFKAKCEEEEKRRQEEQKEKDVLDLMADTTTDGAETSEEEDDEQQVKAAPKAKQVALNTRAKRRLNRRLKEIEKERQKNKELTADVILESSDSALMSSPSEDEIECISDKCKRDINLKIRYQREIIRFLMKQGDNFSKLFQELAKKLDVKASNILLCLNERKITIEDTPFKMNITTADILDCCKWNLENEAVGDKHNTINVKLQSNDSKTKETFSIHKLEPLSTVMEKYAQCRGIALEKLVFEFDGEKICPTANPVDLEMEDDSCIDVRIL